MAASWSFGGANFWNPVGWVALGVAIGVTVVIGGKVIYKYAKSKSDPYARPGQKKAR